MVKVEPTSSAGAAARWVRPWETPRPTGSSADDPIHQILLE